MRALPGESEDGAGQGADGRVNVIFHTAAPVAPDARHL